MIITEAIERATGEREIYFLLEAYLESIHFCDPHNMLPRTVKQLPLTGPRDVERRRHLLDTRVPPARDERQAQLIREAREVMSTAAGRLQTLTLSRYPAAA